MDKEKLLIARVSDKIKRYIKDGCISCTCFLDPAEQLDVRNILKGIPHFLFGGFDEAERKIGVIGKDVYDEEMSNLLCAIRITSNEQLQHRSVLGSTLGLGISREKIGDIIINEKVADVIVQKEILEFLINNLTRVGREKVTIKKIGFDDVLQLERKNKELNVTVASLRLDAVVSASLGLSREKSSSLIEGERVNVNYKLVTSTKKQVNEADLISVRGYGRIKVVEILGESRSGRIKLKINKF